MPPAETAAIASCIFAFVLVMVDWGLRGECGDGGGRKWTVVLVAVVAPSLADFIGVRSRGERERARLSNPHMSLACGWRRVQQDGQRSERNGAPLPDLLADLTSMGWGQRFFT